MRQSRLALVLVCGLIVVSLIALVLTIWYIIVDNKKWQGDYSIIIEPPIECPTIPETDSTIGD